MFLNLIQLKQGYILAKSTERVKEEINDFEASLSEAPRFLIVINFSKNRSVNQKREKYS